MVKRADDLLVGADEVAAFLGWHVNTLRKYATTYPPAGAGFPSHLNGRWHVVKAEILAWREYVVRQENRHPEARRMRPVEPPEVAAIVGRGTEGGGPRTEDRGRKTEDRGPARSVKAQ